MNYHQQLKQSTRLLKLEPSDLQPVKGRFELYWSGTRLFPNQRRARRTKFQIERPPQPPENILHATLKRLVIGPKTP